MPSNNETILMQNVADLQAQVAHRDKTIKGIYALWEPVFQWGLLQVDCRLGDSVQEFVLRKLKSIGAIEDQLELANALNADLQAQLAAANVRQAELLAALEQERKRLDWAMKKQAYYGRSPDRLWVDVGTGNHKWFAVYDDNPRATIDQIIAAEAVGGSYEPN